MAALPQQIAKQTSLHSTKLPTLFRISMCKKNVISQEWENCHKLCQYLFADGGRQTVYSTEFHINTDKTNMENIIQLFLGYLSDQWEQVICKETERYKWHRPWNMEFGLMADSDERCDPIIQIGSTCFELGGIGVCANPKLEKRKFGNVSITYEDKKLPFHRFLIDIHLVSSTDTTDDVKKHLQEAYANIKVNNDIQRINIVTYEEFMEREKAQANGEERGFEDGLYKFAIIKQQKNIDAFNYFAQIKGKPPFNLAQRSPQKSITKQFLITQTPKVKKEVIIDGDGFMTAAKDGRPKKRAIPHKL